jgi:glycosyltransferase involved in cell wall biosynthesis
MEGKRWSISFTGYHQISSYCFKQAMSFQFRTVVWKIIRNALLRARMFLRVSFLFEHLLIFNAFKQHYQVPNESDRRHFVHYLDKLKPDCVIVDYAWLTPILKSVNGARRPLRVVLTHDLIYSRVESLKANSLPVDVPDWTAVEEARHLKSADVLLIEREDEIGSFRTLAPQAKILLAPLAVTTRSITTKEVDGRCLFVGGYAPHNHEGLVWFLEEVWPRVLKVLPHASLVVCGAVCDRIGKLTNMISAPSVIWQGRVADLEDHYTAAQVSIVPLLSGSGFKTKLIEAMSYGKTVVSTTVGAQGITELENPPVLVANNSQEFTEHLVIALTNFALRQKMSQRALAYVSNNLSPERLYGPIISAIKCNSNHDNINTKE